MKFIHPLPIFAVAALALLHPARAQVTGSTLQINDTATFGLAPDYGSFQWRDNGVLISKGTFGQGALLPADQGAGARLLWYPGKAAFRAGRLSLNDSNIGSDSIAMGKDAIASGVNAIALGMSSATGAESFATTGGAGLRNTASGWTSIAMGGVSNVASGGLTVAIGGYYNISSGANAFTTGGYNIASGSQSAAFGTYNRAESSNSFVIGRYNIGGFAPTGNTNWVATDPLLEVGNGASPAVRSNALTVYKNGNATFQGVVRVAPGGDIPMYSGN